MVTQDFILGISGGIIMLLLGGFTWFAKFMIRKQDDINKTLEKAIHALNKSIEQLNTAVEKLKLTIDQRDAGCITTHQIVDKRLNSHSVRLDKLEKDVLILDSKIVKDGKN